MHEFYDKGDYVKYYHLFNGRFAIKRAKHVISFFNSKCINVHSWLDLASGTGSFLDKIVGPLNIQEAVGLDCSKNMIEYAQACINRPNIKFIYGDMTDFNLNKKFNAVSCNYNAINELFPFLKLKNMFNAVYNHLENDGWFLFDFNTVNKFKKGGRVIFTETDECDEVAINNPISDGKVKFKTITYSKNDEGLFVKNEYEMTQYEYSTKKIYKELKSVGFKQIYLLDENFKKINIRKASRIYVLCTKKSC